MAGGPLSDAARTRALPVLCPLYARDFSRHGGLSAGPSDRTQKAAVMGNPCTGPRRVCPAGHPRDRLHLSGCLRAGQCRRRRSPDERRRDLSGSVFQFLRVPSRRDPRSLLSDPEEEKQAADVPRTVLRGHDAVDVSAGILFSGRFHLLFL